MSVCQGKQRPSSTRLLPDQIRTSHPGRILEYQNHLKWVFRARDRPSLSRELEIRGAGVTLTVEFLTLLALNSPPTP